MDFLTVDASEREAGFLIFQDASMEERPLLHTGTDSRRAELTK
jgi:hypothetical protein